MVSKLAELSFVQKHDLERKRFVDSLNQQAVLKRLDSDEFFSGIVEASIRWGLKPMDLARATKMSPATISRWANRQTAPHPLIRPAIVAEICRLLGRG